MRDLDEILMVEPFTEREIQILTLMEQGCSNKDISEKLYITLDTVKWYNKRIYSKLGVQSRTQAIARARSMRLLDMGHDKPTEQGAVARHNLPLQLTSFIGRQKVIEDIQTFLHDKRLITLCGPPGTGKSRLALHVAAEVVDQYTDGIYFVDLAAIRDEKFLLPAIAESFDLKENSGTSLINLIARYVDQKKMLIILDNFEQIIDAAPQIAELLSCAAVFKIIVTSREVLQIYGEQTCFVPPLNLPDPCDLDNSSELQNNEAIQLFIQRAKSVRADLALSEESIKTIAAICMQLDGLPLSIELAAARIRLLNPEAMLEKLRDRLGTLVGGARDLPERMQTLRATIDWSYDLLDDDEKEIFIRTAVFRGGRSLDSLKAVCDAALGEKVLDGLESLLNKSLITMKENTIGEPRFFLLETIHEYAREKLVLDHAREEIERKHAEYFVEIAERAEKEFWGEDQRTWYIRLRIENENLRTALRWALNSENCELGLRLVSALRDYWYYRGFIHEGLQWTQDMLEKCEKMSGINYARALNAAGCLAYAMGSHEQGRQWNHAALDLFREMNEPVYSAWALIFLAAHSLSQNEFVNGISMCEEGLAIFRNAGEKAGVTRALNRLGELWRIAGDYEKAGCVYEECLKISRDSGDRHREAFMLANLGFVVQRQGDHKKADRFCKQALALFHELGSDYFVAIVLAFLAGPATAFKNYTRALVLLGASQVHLEAMGVRLQPVDQFEIDRYICHLEAEVSPEDFERNWSRGAGMTLREAVDFALDNGA